MLSLQTSLAGSRVISKKRVKLNVTGFIDTIADVQAANERLSGYLHSLASVCCPARINGCQISDSILRSYCHCIIISLLNEEDASSDDHKGSVSFLTFQCDFEINLIIIHTGPTLGTDEEPMGSDDDGENAEACEIWPLPNRDFLGLWDALHFETEIKNSLISFASTGLYFEDRQVDSNLVAWNKLILLHGPPGTGKTSLARALAHELSILMRDRFSTCNLMEISSHSLFSKWFSESGKLVARLFEHIRELLAHGSFLCVLIDEVESLTASRANFMKGNEPLDAIRAVNALLTQIDSLKRHTNVIVLATSNLIDALDPAFIDRSDLQLRIGLPSLPCRADILRSSLLALSTKNVIGTPSSEDELNQQINVLATCTDGFSGRALRKLPFQTFCVKFSSTNTFPTPSFTTFCTATRDICLATKNI